MDQLTDLKAILHSKRANIYYLEMCRVMQKEDRHFMARIDQEHFYRKNIRNSDHTLREVAWVPDPAVRHPVSEPAYGRLVCRQWFDEST